jgi:hypothetical protein
VVRSFASITDCTLGCKHVWEDGARSWRESVVPTHLDSGTAAGARQTPNPRSGTGVGAPPEAAPLAGMAVGVSPEANPDSGMAV